MAAKPALGRGLSALLGGSPALAKAPPEATAPEPALDSASIPAVNSQDRVERIPLGQLRACALQPRKHFAPEALQELADSIRERGILQPLIVRKRGDYFELIAGERRWRAAQLVGLAEAPAIVREADDRAVLELALIENLQRENLNAIEEAHGYSELIGQFQLKQDEIAARVGKSRAVVANALRLLKLAAPIQNAIRDGRLSVGHAKVILGIAGEEQQQLAANRILKENLNVRQTEALVAKLQARPTGTSKARATAPGQDGHVAAIENQLRERLGAKVHLRYSQGKGALEIWFFSDDDLERLLQILGIQPD
jgi:ParB family chromosome partitioning protein